MLYRTSIAPFFSLRRDIDRLFDDAMGRDGGQGGWAPTVDIREDEKALVLEVELPGVSPEQVEVTAENGILTVRGDKRSERREDDDKRRWHLIERSYGSFQRAFQLPQGVDEGQIEAAFEHGVLTVRVPKSALPQPRKIEVRAGARGAQQVTAGGQTRDGSGGARNREIAAGGRTKEEANAR